MVYTICIGSNEQRRANLALARRRLSELFPGIRFSRMEETAPLLLKRPALFANQLARFASDCPVNEVVARLKAIEQEAGRTHVETLQEIIRLDIDLLSCDATVYKPDDLRRDYVMRGLKELETGLVSDVQPRY
ncbi:2-amino-4-hydroxy-6-hydroxymethyldihydropteridine diphosphokinase [uncultured Bacteroides sp.]|uniref:2-amino-4-hydroxy-6- hydroxymethyldihydropteridine diphosphokinase n=1 Tax=uncultured Bacteroides sp. TaxID=162156 RepID=UPI00262EABEC|nr:2-amino-4-hydroxy-6-hydroxymethyldihydropteridine diphosphokinase [uncultured Bacteroides sp.]